MKHAVDLQRVIAALLRSANLLLIAAVSAFLVATAVAAEGDDDYEARALVDAQQLLGDEDAFSNSERADRTVANELVVAGEPAVAELVAERLPGTDADELRDSTTIEQLAGTDNIAFVARADGPVAVARQATGYAAAYAEIRLEQRRASLLRQADDVDRELAVLSEQLASLPPLGGEQAASREQVLREQYEALVARGLELRTSARSVATAEQLVLPAPVPEGPAGPGPLVWGVVGAVLALLLGAGIVALRHRVLDPVESRHDLEVAGVRVLAEAPAVRNPWRRTGSAGAVETAVAALVVHEPAHEVVAVVPADDSDVSGVAAVLEVSLADQSSRVRCLPASTATAQGLRTAREADLVLLVARRGVTPRAAVVQALERLDAVRAEERLALLLDARGTSRTRTPPDVRRSTPGDAEPSTPGRRRVRVSSARPQRTGTSEPSAVADGRGYE